MDKKCNNPPFFRFTWPGKDEDYICAIHALEMERVIKSMGLHVQFIRLSLDEMVDHTCCQKSQEEGE